MIVKSILFFCSLWATVKLAQCSMAESMQNENA